MSNVTEQSGGYPGKWSGKFIWDQGEAVPRHYFLMFRKTFELKSDLKSAALCITAADKYMLYVNGQYLGRGPARSVGPQWTSYDIYDLCPKLVKGRNVIAVLAYYYGCRNGYSVNQRPGFWAQAEFTFADGKSNVLGTDESWRVKHAKGYRRDVEAINGAHGMLTEIYDAARDPVEWKGTDYDDSAWGQASVIPFSLACWSCLEPRTTPLLKEREVLPVKIMKLGEVRELPKTHDKTVVKETQVPERLAVEPHYELKYAKVENTGSLLEKGKGPALFQSSPYSENKGESLVKGSRDPFIILDFGRPVFGFPRIEFKAPARAVVELTYTTQLVDGRAPCLELASRFGDAYIAREGEQLWQLFEGRPFRYLQVVFRNVADQLSVNPGDVAGYKDLLKKNDRPIKVKSISVVSYEYPAEVKGGFECSDETLTKLWKAGVDTVYLQMEDTFVMDGVRERLLYGLFGEMEQSHLAIYAGFGDISITDHHFRQTTRMQLPDGQFPFFMQGGRSSPGFPKPEMPLGAGNSMTLLNYMPFYGQAVRSRYWYFGKDGFLEEHYPALVRLAGWCERHIDENGLLYNLPGWLWFDWVKNEVRGANFETNAVYYKMLTDMSEMAGWLELPKDEKKWAMRAERVRNSLRNLHWNSTAGLFADSVINSGQSPIFTELANAFALLYGIADDGQAGLIVKRLMDSRYDEMMADDNRYCHLYLQKRLKDPNVQISCASPLYFYYVIAGLTKAGAADTAIKYLSERFEVMMQAEFPTLTECWPEPGAEHSGNASIHSGAGGVVWYLSTQVLGIQPLQPGFRWCRIEPKCGHLRYAKGMLPSVRGDIAVSWKKERSLFTLDVELPGNLETEVVVPFIEGSAPRLTHNEKSYSIPADVSSTQGLTVQGKRIIFQVQGGRHHFRLETS